MTRTKALIVSALGAIPKPNSENICLIHDCSRPAHSNINSYATMQHFSYMTLDKAVSLITPDAFLAKIDLKSAYHHVPIHPSNYSATGLAWQFSGEHHSTFMYDCKLPLGTSKSPEIFHRLTQAITQFMTKRSFRTVLAYLDDFLIIGNSESECEIVYNELIRLLGNLGFKINWNKVVPPTQRLNFLGVEIDTVNRQLSLPDSKLCELPELLSVSMAKQSITKRALPTLISKLNFAARMVFGGRMFLQPMIDTVNSLRHPHHHIRPTAALKADLAWWAEFWSVFDGTCFFVESEPVDSDEFSTDECPLSAGGFLHGDWFYLNWAADCPVLAGAHINLQETYTVLVELRRWKQDLSDKWLTVRTNNTTTVRVINKGTSPNTQTMCWLREIFCLSTLNNVRITARYISTSENTVADALSRLHDSCQCKRFLSHAYESNSVAARVTREPHISSNAFASLPLQVQYMLGNKVSTLN